jgi:phytanoyl-CoA hydroxylase
MDIDRKDLERDGFVVVPGAYTQEEVDDLNHQYQRLWIDEVVDGTIRQSPEKSPMECLFPRMRDRHRDNRTIFEWVMKPAVVDAMERILGEEALLISTNYYFKAPGTKGMPNHQDNYGIGVFPGTCYAIWVSLEAADVSNGAMRFVRGTHRLPLVEPVKRYDSTADTFSGYVQEVPAPEGSEVVVVRTNPGDLILYHGHVIHDSADNMSRHHFRRSIISHFAGKSVEKLTLNHNYLLNREGERLRKRLQLRALATSQ